MAQVENELSLSDPLYLVGAVIYGFKNNVVNCISLKLFLVS